jgi:hypothetical protein
VISSPLTIWCENIFDITLHRGFSLVCTPGGT